MVVLFATCQGAPRKDCVLRFLINCETKTALNNQGRLRTENHIMFISRISFLMRKIFPFVSILEAIILAFPLATSSGVNFIAAAAFGSI